MDCINMDVLREGLILGLLLYDISITAFPVGYIMRNPYCTLRITFGIYVHYEYCVQLK